MDYIQIPSLCEITTYFYCMVSLKVSNNADLLMMEQDMNTSKLKRTTFNAPCDQSSPHWLSNLDMYTI